MSIFCIMQNLKIGRYQHFSILHHVKYGIVLIMNLKYQHVFILHNVKFGNFQTSSVLYFAPCKQWNSFPLVNVKYKNFHI